MKLKLKVDILADGQHCNDGCPYLYQRVGEPTGELDERGDPAYSSEDLGFASCSA